MQIEIIEIPETSITFEQFAELPKVNWLEKWEVELIELQQLIHCLEERFKKAEPLEQTRLLKTMAMYYSRINILASEQTETIIFHSKINFEL